MNRRSKKGFVVITMIVSIYVMTNGLATYIDLSVQLTNTLYSAGHNVGIYFKELFN